MNRFAQQWRPAMVGLLGIALGVFAMTQTSGISELGRVFPITASLISIAAGVAILVQILLSPRETAGTTEETDYLRAGLFAATMLIWAVSLDRFGFVSTSGIAVVVIAAISRRDPMSMKSIVGHAVAGVALVMGFSLLLGNVLNVPLP